MPRRERQATKRRAPIYRFFVRRLFLGVGTTEKLADVRSAGIIGATLVVVLTLTLPAGVSVALVRMRKRFLRIFVLRSPGELTRGEVTPNGKGRAVNGVLRWGPARSG